MEVRRGLRCEGTRSCEQQKMVIEKREIVGRIIEDKCER